VPAVGGVFETRNQPLPVMATSYGAAGGLEGTVAHDVVDRAELDAEADLGRLGAGVARRGRGAGALQLGERVAE
jgi:hypothetical protein